MYSLIDHAFGSKWQFGGGLVAATGIEPVTKGL
jgi:hypothetical protein